MLFATLILMPGKLAIIFLLIIFFVLNSFFLIHNSSALAQTATPTGIPTCDLCGWCNRSINPKPPDWDNCRKCLYDNTGAEIKGKYYTVLGCFSTTPGDYVQKILSIVFSVAGGIAFLTVLGGSIMVLTSSGNPEKLKEGKDMISNSLIGILIILFAVFILRLIGLDILKIPGFA